MSRDPFDQFLKDLISIVKADGTVFENVKASVRSDTIMIRDVSIPIEEGDRVIRILPNNLSEEYEVLDRGFNAAFHNISANYQMKVRKVNNAAPKNVAKLLTGQDIEYIDPIRIEELKTIKSDKYDLSKLITLCEEVNRCFKVEAYFAVAMLLRAIMDHIPPIFECKNFGEVANNYKGARSFKEAMQSLDNSSRKIADAFLHLPIRSKESLPNLVQVNYASMIDVLLAEIIRLLK